MPEGTVCNSVTVALPYTASIQVQPFVAIDRSAWDVRVYHRGKPLPVPPISH